MNAKQEPREEISYKLLEEISREGTVSQRALADRLGIALGLVNAYVKRLCSKGYLKLKFLPKNRIKYIITPQGFAEKSRLTYKYMHYSILYFKSVREKIERTYTAMVGAGVQRVLLWGDGELAELCYISTRGFPLEIVGVVDERKAGKAFFDRQIYAVGQMDQVAYDAVLISALDDKVRDTIIAAGVDSEKIYLLEQ